MKNLTRKVKEKSHVAIFWIVTGLIAIGLLLILSAGSAIGSLKQNNFAFFFIHQARVIILALVAFLVALLIPYKFYEKVSVYFMLLIVIALAVVLIGKSKNGAARWLDLGIISFQPSEFAKIVLVFHLSKLITRIGEVKIRNIKKLGLPLTWIGVTSVLVAAEPNYSNAGIIGFLGLVMLYIGGAKKRQLFLIALLAGMAFVTSIWLTPHSHKRIQGMLNMLTHSEVQAPSAQANEALIALGSGGTTGVGLGHSQQANLFLPEPYGDFIFAVLGEETGFLGTVSVSTLYLFFFLMALLTLSQIEDKYGKLLVFGLSFNIVLSALINIAVVLGYLPTTGITLPFVSYGGTSLVGFVFSVGVILNVNSEGKIWIMFFDVFKKYIKLAKKLVEPKLQ